MLYEALRVNLHWLEIDMRGSYIDHAASLTVVLVRGVNKRKRITLKHRHCRNIVSSMLCEASNPQAASAIAKARCVASAPHRPVESRIPRLKARGLTLPIKFSLRDTSLVRVYTFERARSRFFAAQRTALPVARERRERENEGVKCGVRDAIVAYKYTHE